MRCVALHAALSVLQHPTGIAASVSMFRIAILGGEELSLSLARAQIVCHRQQKYLTWSP